MNLEVWVGELSIAEELTEDSVSEEEESADYLQQINFQQQLKINSFTNFSECFLWDDKLKLTHFFEINSPPPKLSVSTSDKVRT